MAILAAHPPSESRGLPWLHRYLAICIFLAMAVGMVFARFVPNTGPALQKGRFVEVPIPSAIGLLITMYPILCKVQFEALPRVLSMREIWKHIFISVTMSWLVAPLLMLGLTWAFLPDKNGLREGLILVGLARGTAIVLIWTDLAGGDSEYCAIFLIVNSALQMVLFGPVAILFLKGISHSDVAVDILYATVAKSIAVFLGLPLGAALATRFTLRTVFDPKWYDQDFIQLAAPWSLLGLLFTIFIFFASQEHQLVHQIISVAHVAAPLLLYFGITFTFTILLTHRLGFGYKLSVSHSFTVASNSFELAIAVTIAAFGTHSDQALASGIGPLIEVPMLLTLVHAVKWIGQQRYWEA